ncbi:hypothetical protein, partial [endosymbiont of Ridgeia piscesae]|uniref:hypothetical protein n=1 Tax=endosymbiont of Ridgeia piscesae TaxID=54398 RepID=UPI001F25036F
IESPGAWISAAMNIAEQLGMVDAYYGSSVYMPLAEGAEFIVSRSIRSGERVLRICGPSRAGFAWPA